MAKCRELARELRLIGYNNEELRACAIGLARKQRRRDRSLSERDIADLRLQTEVESPGPILCARLRIFCFRIAALHHSMSDYAVENRAVIEALLGKLYELPHVGRSLIAVELHN